VKLALSPSLTVALAGLMLPPAPAVAVTVQVLALLRAAAGPSPPPLQPARAGRSSHGIRWRAQRRG